MRIKSCVSATRSSRRASIPAVSRSRKPLSGVPERTAMGRETGAGPCPCQPRGPRARSPLRRFERDKAILVVPELAPHRIGDDREHLGREPLAAELLTNREAVVLPVGA